MFARHQTSAYVYCLVASCLWSWSPLSSRHVTSRPGPSFHPGGILIFSLNILSPRSIHRCQRKWICRLVFQILFKTEVILCTYIIYCLAHVKGSLLQPSIQLISVYIYLKDNLEINNYCGTLVLSQWS